jgi:hypothetical protein
MTTGPDRDRPPGSAGPTHGPMKDPAADADPGRLLKAVRCQNSAMPSELAFWLQG